MILDKLATFGSSLSVVASVGNAILGDVIDVGAHGKGLFIEGGKARIVVQFATDVDSSADNTTLKFEVRSSTLAALTGGTTVTHFTTAVLAQTTCVAGYKAIDIDVPVLAAGQRYLGLWLTIGTADSTVGTIDAHVVPQTVQIPIAS